MTNLSNHDVFQGKRRLLPRSVCRLPVFCSQNQTKTTYGTVEVMSGNLTQTHRDILEAIAVVGKRGEYKDGTRTFYVFTPYEVLKFLGHRHLKHHKWLIQKLADMRSVNIQFTYLTQRHQITMVGGILDYFAWSSKLKRPKKRPTAFGENYFVIVFSEPFSSIFRQDMIIYTKPEVVKAIIQIPSDQVKALVRFVLSHEQLYMSLDDLLRHMGLILSDRTRRKLAKKLQDFSEYLLTHFGIRIVQKDQLFIVYKKNPDIVAIDYTPNT